MVYLPAKLGKKMKYQWKRMKYVKDQLADIAVKTYKRDAASRGVPFILVSFL